MKKRIEKVVKNFGDLYEVYKECKHHYYVIDENEGMLCLFKNKAKVVSEREVLEFDVSEVHIANNTDIDLTNYDLKVIATPKDKTYEDMSKEELIKLLKAKE